MTNLPTSPTSRTPIALSASQHRRVEEMFINLDETSFRSWRFRDRDIAPSDGERLFLRQRAEVLDAWLQPVSLRVLEIELTAMFSTMAFRSGDEKDFKLVERIYRDDLAGVPAFALSQACARFRKAEIGDGKFMPKQGEIRKEAMRIAKDFLEERARIQAIASAEVPPAPESPERRKQIVTEWKNEMRRTIDAARPPNEIARGYAEQPVEPVAPKSEQQKLDELAERLKGEPTPRLSGAAMRLYAMIQPEMTAAE
jgi:hypothetical protein